MSVSIIDDTPMVLTEIEAASSLFLRLFLDDIHRYSDPITPMKDGYLRRSVLKSVLGLKGNIKWLKEYAASQEAGMTRGHQIKNYTTPGTGKDYAKRAIKMAMLNAGDTMKKARLIR